MADRSYLGWPFFTDGQRAFAAEVEAWGQGALPGLVPAAADEEDEAALDRAVRALVVGLGSAGLLRACVPKRAGGRAEAVEVRALCLARDILARHSGLADFAFAMQALGSAPITLFGTDAQKNAYLPGVARGGLVAAFALSEAAAGSDVAAISATARRDGAGFRLDGAKTWISNAGIADFYVVFARSGEAEGTRGLSAFVVDAEAPGLAVSARIPLMAPHPIGTLEFDGCRVPAAALLGQGGDGFRIAMATLDRLRATVGAAALGLARAALDAAVARALDRRLFGTTLAEMQLTQAALADAAVAIDASALLVYRAAWTADVSEARPTRETSMAKLFSTEAAQGVIDRAVQLFGGLGVVRGVPVERLYREIRALRIYEGASEVQKLVIARHVLADRPGA